MPEIKKVNINKVKANPNNPRLIKDDKFFKLVKSIQEFPQMLDIRPIVVNDDMIVLGGNMRLKACKEAGLKEVPIIMASDLTQDQQREFIIKDNVGFGEWDWEDLANNWDVNELSNWGLDVPTFLDADETIEIDEQPKRPSIKISFDTINDVQAAENDVKELIDRKYPKAICSVII
jgi:ParB-like chromosome segregation protein Spo0J